MDDIDDAVRTWTTPRTKQELFDALDSAGIPCAPVQSLREVVTDPVLAQSGMLRMVGSFANCLMSTNPENAAPRASEGIGCVSIAHPNQHPSFARRVSMGAARSVQKTARLMRCGPVRCRSAVVVIGRLFY